MPTSIDDLLRQARATVKSGAPGAESAEKAAATVGEFGRALRALPLPEVDSRHQCRRQVAAEELTRACMVVRQQFPSSQSHVVDLAAVAADAVVVSASDLDPDERWAVIAELARTIDVATQIATEFEPYANVPALRRAGRLCEVVRQVAAADPAPVHALATLDTPIAGIGHGPPTLADATAALVTSIDQAIRAGEFTVAAALTASAGAEAIADQAAALVPSLSTTSSLAPDAWRALQATLRRFDDGSRYAVPTATRITAAALATNDSVERITNWSAEAATEMRYAANQLPVNARRIEAALATWARRGRTFALARALPLAEERVGEVLHNRAVMVRPPDVIAAVLVARQTQRASAALAVDLDHSAGVIGTQPQPRLIRAHIASLSSGPAGAASRGLGPADRVIAMER